METKIFQSIVAILLPFGAWVGAGQLTHSIIVTAVVLVMGVQLAGYALGRIWGLHVSR